MGQFRHFQGPVSAARISGISPVRISGIHNNLAIAQSLDQFPIAAINNQPVKILSATDQELKIQVDSQHLRGAQNELKVALDPYAIVSMKLDVAGPPRTTKSVPRPAQA